MGHRSGENRHAAGDAASAATARCAATKARSMSASEPMRDGSAATAASAASAPRGSPPRPSATAITHDPSSAHSAVNERSSFTSRGPTSLSAATVTTLPGHAHGCSTAIH